MQHAAIEEAGHTVRSASVPSAERGTKPADAWLIERSDGSKEVVLSPLTDDTFMDEGDEAWPLYKALPSAIEPIALEKAIQFKGRADDAGFLARAIIKAFGTTESGTKDG